MVRPMLYRTTPPLAETFQGGRDEQPLPCDVVLVGHVVLEVGVVVCHQLAARPVRAPSAAVVESLVVGRRRRDARDSSSLQPRRELDRVPHKVAVADVGRQTSGLAGRERRDAFGLRGSSNGPSGRLAPSPSGFGRRHAETLPGFSSTGLADSPVAGRKGRFNPGFARFGKIPRSWMIIDFESNQDSATEGSCI